MYVCIMFLLNIHVTAQYGPVIILLAIHATRIDLLGGGSIILITTETFDQT